MSNYRVALQRSLDLPFTKHIVTGYFSKKDNTLIAVGYPLLPPNAHKFRLHNEYDIRIFNSQLEAETWLEQELGK